jgi:hypothetical protein
MITKFRLLAAAAAAGSVVLLGAGAASAAPAAGQVNGPYYNSGEAGYQIESGVSFNEVRTTIHIPAGTPVQGNPTSYYPGTSDFIGLQQTINGGKTFAIGLTDENGEYVLAGIEGNAVNAQAGVPLPSGFVNTSMVLLPTLNAPAGTALFSAATGGSYYVEVHYSTREQLVQYVAGPTETDAATLANVNESRGFFSEDTFHAPAVESINTAGTNLPVNTPEASYTRTGVTEPAGSNFGGIAGTRVTFDFFALNEAEATSTGAAPTVGNTNPVTILPSPALPGVGSAFGIITGA